MSLTHCDFNGVSKLPSLLLTLIYAKSRRLTDNSYGLTACVSKNASELVSNSASLALKAGKEDSSDVKDGVDKAAITRG